MWLSSSILSQGQSIKSQSRLSCLYKLRAWTSKAIEFAASTSKQHVLPPKSKTSTTTCAKWTVKRISELGQISHGYEMSSHVCTVYETHKVVPTYSNVLGL